MEWEYLGKVIGETKDYIIKIIGHTPIEIILSIKKKI